MKNLKKILTAATLVAAASSASAIQFDLNPAYFTPGSGYSDAGDGSFTKLGVDFVADTTPRSFTLEVGDTPYSNTFGTVTLDDGEIFRRLGASFICNGSVLPCLTTNETDNLGVTATFSFSNPLSGLQTVTATGTAAFGFINDSDVDFTITWADKLVDFGNGGQFKISMDTLEFTFDGQVEDQTYSIQMVTAPIPEPETYALMLAGLGLVGFMARRRRKA
jgi:hypothetical protein